MLCVPLPRTILPLLITVLVITASARADSPLPPPTLKTVFRVSGEQRQKLWAMPGRFRVAGLKNDGKHLVTGYDGVNLLSLRHAPDEVLLRFFRGGTLIKNVTLREIIRDRARLQRTASHYYWGNYLGFDLAGRYRVETVEGRRLIFDAATGRIVKAEKVPDAR